MHLTTQNLILIGVGLHLLLSAAKLIFKTPKQQAKIDQIGTKLDSVLDDVQTALPIIQATQLIQATQQATAAPQQATQQAPVGPPAPNNGGDRAATQAAPSTQGA